MTHCRHWQRAHSSGPSLRSGFAVSVHRAKKTEKKRKGREKGRAITITVKWNQLQSCHRNYKRHEQKWEKWGLYFMVQSYLFMHNWRSQLKECWTDRLVDRKKHGESMQCSSTGLETVMINIQPQEKCRWRSGPQRLTWILALWFGIPEDKEINTAWGTK